MTVRFYNINNINYFAGVPQFTDRLRFSGGRLVGKSFHDLEQKAGFQAFFFVQTTFIGFLDKIYYNDRIIS